MTLGRANLLSFTARVAAASARNLTDESLQGIAVLRNLGAATFAPAVVYETSWNAGLPAVIDINGDGAPDLVAAGYSGAFDLLLNYGDGTFDPLISFAGGTSLSGPAVADFSGDGKPDLVAPDFHGDLKMLVNVTP